MRVRVPLLWTLAASHRTSLPTTLLAMPTLPKCVVTKRLRKFGTTREEESSGTGPQEPRVPFEPKNVSMAEGETPPVKRGNRPPSQFKEVAPVQMNEALDFSRNTSPTWSP